MSAQYLQHYTYNDYKNWKEDWELINGYPYSLMPSAFLKHSKVQSKAFIQAGIALEKNGTNCNYIVLNNADWKVNEETVVRPDMMIVCGEATTDFLEFPPVLILEVLSPSIRPKDRTVKFDLYSLHGVKYYLMADYDRRQVEVYELTGKDYQQVRSNTFALDDTCEVAFDFSKWWL